MRVGIIGVGNIGSMILEVLNDKSEHEFYIYNRSVEKVRKYEVFENVKICGNVKEVYTQSDFTFLCVKPQQAKQVYDNLFEIHEEHGVLVSTAAGKRIEEISQSTGKKNVIRIMPTITSRISIGITAVAYSKHVDSSTRHEFEKLLSPLGEVMELEEEKFDAFTVLNSSGPAFVAFILESFIEGAINIGVNPDYARDIVLRTFEGSVKLLEHMSIEPSRLKYLVSSPGGVTIRGLYELEKDGVKGAIMSAIYEAFKRSQEL
ncbi:MAG: pyrroline-5-carboxylate reductase [Fervidobacterium sp.]|uniref:pyrroline-5-carboxylate reductase n=1 Tax=Fervidobacterium sp. TaxID=1871331 RepID=UPI00404A2832